MRFVLIDRITEVVPGKSLSAVKNLTSAEEYLADHFPGFPVMPGVLMLEAFTQAGAWLIRATDDFAHSIIVLRRVKAIKYGQFVAPGHQLSIRVEITSTSESETAFKGVGTVDGQSSVQGRFTLARYNLAEKRADRAGSDAAIISTLRSQYETLSRGLPIAVT